MSSRTLSVFVLDGIPEIQRGDDLVGVICGAAGGSLQPGDILVVTSKIVSKAEGREVPAVDRELAIEQETVRVVAERVHDGGVTRIVENRNGLVMAAAGVDASNVADGMVLLLPADPDLSAQRLREGIQRTLGIEVGVIVSDTFGRPWRLGQTDVVIGAAGVTVLVDFRGVEDTHGHALVVTAPAVGDEIAAAADLVKGKTGGTPVAVVRGLEHLVSGSASPGGAALLRPAVDDLFSQGAAEAYAAGFAAGRAAAGKAVAESEAER
ncbi:F420-dependent oxidoreductase [Leifsonia sp. Leaf336]|uniref:coenzyme F420-0:L-glutamate ligase n=1 Tax=Leifsonia sp. Leaf336 TaxID=1736341 RepID=UPI0006F2BC83|nr:coenzyme F420-0:L-glutamate ligase [Leifsonia sp. Leaf336]KQR50873.1 F420-dependent oxidoreductase [Leifsonia sp. Leaf336]